MIEDSFLTYFQERPETVFRAPGRVEICGNHCDHQNGRVIACAVNRYMEAAVRYREDRMVRMFSEGRGEFRIDLSDLSVREEERETSEALVRGTAAWLSEHQKADLRGFDAYLTSAVPSGSGMSSSAAFEVLTGRILMGRKDRSEQDNLAIALAGRYAENRYFGKPSGLMDQAACSLGGTVFLDFADPDAPYAERIAPIPRGFRICLLNTGGSHENLTEAYSQIPSEMRRIASFFGKEVLQQVTKRDFSDAIPELRGFAGDRAVLRAMHFYEENDRVLLCKKALEEGNAEDFLSCLNASGNSSASLLENIETGSDPRRQNMALALALSKSILGGEGAVRVHGGGFAGTVLALAPEELVEKYRDLTERVFGNGAVSVLEPAM